MSTRITAGLADAPADVDVVVIGLGITGAGVALDAVTRGLSVLAVDAHDLAFGTSRWSSKMVHGGLRYLARGQVGVAHESAVERGILMEVTAPHLTRPMPMLVPLSSGVSRLQTAVTRGGLWAGDLLRRGARTDAETRLRILREEKSAGDVDAPVLVVSQFTLYADARKGRRPTWQAAAPGAVSEPAYAAVCAELERLGTSVQRGVFGADMQVSAVNDGPVTVILDSPRTEPDT